MTPEEQQEHLAKIRNDVRQLCESLSTASEAGVSHALILPQMMLVFREEFGDMPAGFNPMGVLSQ